VRGFPGFEYKDNVSNFPLGREIGEPEDSVEEVGEEYDSDRGQFSEDFTGDEVVSWRFSGVEVEDGSMDIGRCEVRERGVQLVGGL
jgi:hypothetical protein